MRSNYTDSIENALNGMDKKEVLFTLEVDGFDIINVRDEDSYIHIEAYNNGYIYSIFSWDGHTWGCKY